MHSTTIISKIPEGNRALAPDLIRIAASWLLMGSDKGQDCERPIHRVWIDSFLLAATQVTNKDYG